jgi:hypothetical protein
MKLNSIAEVIKMAKKSLTLKDETLIMAAKGIVEIAKRHNQSPRKEAIDILLKYGIDPDKL